MKKLLLLGGLLVSLALTGCGGGSSTPTTTNTSQTTGGEYQVVEQTTPAAKTKGPVKFVPSMGPLGIVSDSCSSCKPIANALVTFEDGTTIQADDNGKFSESQIPAAILAAAKGSDSNTIHVSIEQPAAGAKALADTQNDLPDEADIPVRGDTSVDLNQVAISALEINPPVSILEKGELSSFILNGVTANGQKVPCVSKQGACQISWKIMDRNGTTEDTSDSVVKIAAVGTDTQSVTVEGVNFGIRTLQAICTANCPQGLDQAIAETKIVVVTDFVQFYGKVTDENGNPLSGDWSLLFRTELPDGALIQRAIPFPGKACFSAADLGLPADSNCYFSALVLLPQNATGSIHVEIAIGQKDAATGKTSWFEVADGDANDTISITNSGFDLNLPASDDLNVLSGTQVKVALQKTTTPFSPSFNPPPFQDLVKQAWEDLQDIYENPPYKPGSGVRRIFATLSNCLNGNVQGGTYKGWSCAKNGDTVELNSPNGTIKVTGSRTANADGSATYQLNTQVKQADGTFFTVRKLTFTDQFQNGTTLASVDATTQFFIPPNATTPVKEISAALNVTTDSLTQASYSFTNTVSVAGIVAKTVSGSETIDVTNLGTANAVWTCTCATQFTITVPTGEKKSVKIDYTCSLNGDRTGTSTATYTFPNGTAKVDFKFSGLVNDSENIVTGTVTLTRGSITKTATFSITKAGTLVVTFPDGTTQTFTFEDLKTTAQSRTAA